MRSDQKSRNENPILGAVLIITFCVGLLCTCSRNTELLEPFYSKYISVSGSQQIVKCTTHQFGSGGCAPEQPPLPGRVISNYLHCHSGETAKISNNTATEKQLFVLFLIHVGYMFSSVIQLTTWKRGCAIQFLEARQGVPFSASRPPTARQRNSPQELSS